jgi:glutamate racemase
MSTLPPFPSPGTIGVFDSGMGGLTVLRALQQALPDEPTVYLGDTARVPYGTRSAATVVRYAINNARTLAREAPLKLLVVACNTVSAVALEALRAELPIPVVGVIEPGARAALRASRGGSIAVLATAGTTRSGAYARALGALGFTGRVVGRAAPLLVPLVEEGWLSGEVPTRVVERYVQDLPSDTDVVVLGCTHYPLLRDVVAAVVGPAVAVVDGAVATAAEVAALLDERGQRAAPGTGGHRLLVTDAPEQMVSLGPVFLGRPVDAGSVAQVDIEMSA